MSTRWGYDYFPTNAGPRRHSAPAAIHAHPGGAGAGE